MITEREILENCACHKARTAARAVTRAYDEALRPVGLRATQLAVLVAVAMDDAISINGTRGGTEGGGGSLTEVSGATSTVGTYGTLVINVDGSYTYTLNNNGTHTQELKAGETATDSFTYRVTDAGGKTDLAQLDIRVTGANDAPTASAVTSNSG